MAILIVLFASYLTNCSFSEFDVLFRVFWSKPVGLIIVIVLIVGFIDLSISLFVSRQPIDFNVYLVCVSCH